MKKLFAILLLLISFSASSQYLIDGTVWEFTPSQKMYNGSSYEYMAVSFTCGTERKLSMVSFVLDKTGSPTGNVYAYIYSHTGTYGTSSEPNTLLATSDPQDVSDVATYYEFTYFVFSGSDEITLSASTYYTVVLCYGTGGDASNYILVCGDVTGHDGNGSYSSDGSSWTTTSVNYCFQVFGTTTTAELIQVHYKHPLGYTAMYNGSYTCAGQSFNCGTTSNLIGCGFMFTKQGSPTGNVTAYLYAHTGTFGSGGLPTGSALATSNTLNISAFDNNRQFRMLTFSGSEQYLMTAGTKYFIIISYTGGDSGNTCGLWVSTKDPPAGNPARSTNCSSWTATTTDYDYVVYGEPFILESNNIFIGTNF